MTAIDFGSSKIAVACGVRQGGGVKIVSYHDAPSSGITHGEILNDFQVESTVRELIDKVSEDIGEPVNDVVVGIGAKILHNDNKLFTTVRNAASTAISEAEIEDITRKRFNTHNADDEVVLEAVPERYNIDDYIGLDAASLKGMTGKEIETQFLLVFGKADIMNRRRNILDRCGLTMRKAVLSPIAAARAVLTEPEAENGAALLDIGHGTSELVIVKDNLVREVATIPFAGESITRDIKNLTNITSKWAEDVKVAQGCCVESEIAENSKLLLKDAEGNTVSEIDNVLLSRIVGARMTEILEAVKYILDNSPYGGKLPSGVIITGGTAHLGSLRQLAQAVLGRKVRLAAPRTTITSDSVEAAFDTFASVATGLVLEGFESGLSHAVSFIKKAERQEEGSASKGGGIFRNIFGSGSSSNSSSGVQQPPVDKEAERKKKEEEKKKQQEERKRKAAEEKAKKQAKDTSWGLFSELMGNSDDDNV